MLIHCYIINLHIKICVRGKTSVIFISTTKMSNKLGYWKPCFHTAPCNPQICSWCHVPVQIYDIMPIMPYKFLVGLISREKVGLSVFSQKINCQDKLTMTMNSFTQCNPHIGSEVTKLTFLVTWICKCGFI